MVTPKGEPSDGAGGRRAAERRGRGAERLAMLRLRLTGWRILDRRYRVPVGEIDLIARRGGVIAFVEVKRRDDRHTALEAVTPAQQRRIARAAAAFLASPAAPAGLAPRFDIVLVRPGRWPEHIPAAFDVPDPLLRRSGW